jgi:hypothetical protein
MTIYQPYFYIIQDISNGMYYAGAKWGKDANPETFMVEGGYTTSSNTIKELILKHGIGRFIVRKIRCFDSAEKTYNYETKFLKRIDAKNNKSFYNSHNNVLFTYGSTEYKEYMMKTYGVEIAMHSEEIKNRLKQTNIEKHGVEWVMMSQKVKETTKTNNLEKYGVENPMQLDAVKNKVKLTMIEKYGYESPQQVPEIRMKTAITNTKKYGGSSPACSEAVMNKMKQTCIERYGVDSYAKSELGKKESSSIKINKRKREIVDLILKNTTKRQRSDLGLTKGWYQKEDDYLLSIYERLPSISN